MGATLQWFNQQLYFTLVNHWTTIVKHSSASRGKWLFLMRNIPSSFSVWIRPCRRRQLPFWTLNMKSEKKRILVITESLMRWCRLTEEPQNTPNAANCGSFFHFPKEAGGLIHVTLVWRSRSPMERSTTCPMNKTPAIFSASHRMENSVFLPLFFHHSARGWADQRRLQTPRGSSASRWCGWQLCSSLSWQLQTNGATPSMGCNWFNHVWAVSNLITSSYRRGGNAPHCLGLWASKVPLARAGTSVPSGWAWSGRTPVWKSAAVWGCAHLRRPWNLGPIWLEWPKKDLMEIIYNHR